MIESSFGNDESVKQCLEIMKDVSAEQRARARHLDAKTGTLAGFSATILTLTVALGRPLLAEDLRGAGNMLIEVFFMITVIALTLAALAAIGGVLRPMGHYDLEESQIDAYSDRPKVITDPAELRMTWLRTVTDMALSDRAAGSAKSKFAVAAVVLLIVGLLGVAGQAITLVFSHERRTQQAEQRTAPSPSGNAAGTDSTTTFFSQGHRHTYRASETPSARSAEEAARGRDARRLGSGDSGQ